MSRQASARAAAPARAAVAPVTARRAGAPAAQHEPVRMTDRAVPDVARHREAALRAPLPHSLLPRDRDPATVIDWARGGTRGALPAPAAIQYAPGRSPA